MISRFYSDNPSNHQPTFEIHAAEIADTGEVVTVSNDDADCYMLYFPGQKGRQFATFQNALNFALAERPI